MSELAQAMRSVTAIRTQIPIETNGLWHFVGHVDARLCYIHTDGSPLTDEEMRAFLRDANIAGPGFAMRPHNVKARYFASRAEAEAAVAALWD